MGAERRLCGGIYTTQLGDLRAAKREWSARLLPVAPAAVWQALRAAVSPAPGHNVVGVGIGEKLVGGQSAGVLALKFLVRLKYPAAQIDRAHRLPKTIHGLPTDVEQVGVFRCLPKRRVVAAGPMPNPRRRIRPAPPGSSVGFRDPSDRFVMAGTFGALVKGARGLGVLSNNHVLANENRLPAGAPIYQPGLLDQGNPRTDQIARLAQAVALRPGKFNKVDCALAAVVKSSLVTNEILQVGAPRGPAAAALDMIVHKFGRTTGYRAGRVTSIDTDVTVQYETGNFAFAGQMIIVGLDGQVFSDAGDSGSLILERSSRQAIGLLFAGSPSHTIGNHLADVLAALGVTLA